MMDYGTYDVIVVEEKEKDDQLIQIEFAITSGARRGEMIAVTTKRLARPPLDLLGTPATLFVSDGAPRIEWTLASRRHATMSSPVALDRHSRTGPHRPAADERDA